MKTILRSLCLQIHFGFTEQSRHSSPDVLSLFLQTGAGVQRGQYASDTLYLCASDSKRTCSQLNCHTNRLSSLRYYSVDNFLYNDPPQKVAENHSCRNQDGVSHILMDFFCEINGVDTEVYSHSNKCLLVS